MRKSALSFLALSLAFSILPLAAAPIRLLMWGGVPPESGPQLVCDAFNKEFASKGISIEYERFVNDDQGNMKLETNLLAGGDIDIYITYTMDRLRKRSTGNMALNLEPFMKKTGFNLDTAIGAEGAMISRIDGTTYGVASKTYNNGFWVNKNMFDAAGIPVPKSWTLDEFKAITRKLTKGSGDSKVYGAFLQTNSYKTLAAEFAGVNLGGNAVYSKDHKSTAIDNPVFEKALGTIVELMNDGSIPSHADSLSQKLQGAALFTSGKVAMVFGSWLYRDIKNVASYPHDFVAAYVPLPSDNSKAYYMNGGPGDQVCINPKSKNVEAAWTFVKWYVEGGIIPMAPFGRFPLYTKVDMAKLEATALAGVERYFDRASTVNGFLTPAKTFQVETFADPQVQAVLAEEFELAMLGSKAVKQALADAKRRSDPILAAKP